MVKESMVQKALVNFLKIQNIFQITILFLTVVLDLMKKMKGRFHKI